MYSRSNKFQGSEPSEFITGYVPSGPMKPMIGAHVYHYRLSYGSEECVSQEVSIRLPRLLLQRYCSPLVSPSRTAIITGVLSLLAIDRTSSWVRVSIGDIGHILVFILLAGKSDMDVMSWAEQLGGEIQACASSGSCNVSPSPDLPGDPIWPIRC